MGPELMEEEIEASVRDLKEKKAEGVDGIPAEFWTNVGTGAMSEIVCLCKEIYRTGEWPKYFVRTVMIPIPKTAKATVWGV